MNKLEAIAHLKEFIKKIDTQDTRCTAKPYFYVIRTEKWRVAHGEYHSGKTKQVWVDTTGEDDYREWKSPKEYGADLIRNCGYSAKEARAAIEHGLQEFTMEAYYDDDNVFFTEEGYNEHVRLNGHNLGLRDRDYYSYVKHAFRNPELEGLFRALRTVLAEDDLLNSVQS